MQFNKFDPPLSTIWFCNVIENPEWSGHSSPWDTVLKMLISMEIPNFGTNFNSFSTQLFLKFCSIYTPNEFVLTSLREDFIKLCYNMPKLSNEKIQQHRSGSSTFSP